MIELIKRLGFVVMMTIGCALGGAIAALIFGYAKVALSGGRPPTIGGAIWFGFGLFGALGALIGALGGQDMTKESGKTPTRFAEAITWTFAAIVALLLFFGLFRL